MIVYCIHGLCKFEQIAFFTNLAKIFILRKHFHDILIIQFKQTNKKFLSPLDIVRNGDFFLHFLFKNKKSIFKRQNSFCEYKQISEHKFLNSCAVSKFIMSSKKENRYSCIEMKTISEVSQQ